MPIPAILGAAASAAGSAMAGSTIGSTILGGLSSAGSFMSGLGGLFGGGKAKRGPSFTDQLGMNDQFIFHDTDSRLRAAKAFGIHPLLMLGQTPSIQPVGSFGTESSPMLLISLLASVTASIAPSKLGLQRRPRLCSYYCRPAGRKYASAE